LIPPPNNGLPPLTLEAAAFLAAASAFCFSLKAISSGSKSS